MPLPQIIILGAGLGGTIAAYEIRDAANLHDHAGTNVRKAEMGSPAFMRCSPTRKAV